MIRAAAACAGVFIVGAASYAQHAPAPEISTTFPPARDVRKPDLTISMERSPVLLVAYTGNGRTLVTAGADHVIRLWEARPGAQGTGAFIRELAGHTGRIRAIAAGPAPGTVVSIADDLTMRTWDETTGALLKNVPYDETSAFIRHVDPQGAPASASAIANDGKTLATAAEDGHVRLWSLDTGTLLRTFRAHSGHVGALAFDPRGEQLAAGDAAGAIHVWDVASGALLATQRGHTAAVRSIAFSSNGQKMASGAADGTARTWTVPLPPLHSATLARITAASRMTAAIAPQKPRRILVVWRADAILHKSGVPALNHAIETISNQTGAFEADFTRDVDAFDSTVLAKYDAIVMNSTAHLQLTPSQRQAYLDYVRHGGGVVGIHAAIDMFLTWPEGARVIGATFGDHPWGPSGTWAVKLEDPRHRLLRAFGGKNFSIKDELYVMGEPYSRADRTVLLSVDLSDPTTAGVNLTANSARAKDKDFALAWTKRYGRGRVFYANFGHIAEALERRDIQQFYLDGIQWVLGDLEM